MQNLRWLILFVLFLGTADAAMEQLIEHTKEYSQPGEGVVVVGDFNTSKEQVNLAGDTTLKKIEEAGFFWTFEGIPLEHRITIPRKGSYPDACFDHIYVRDLGKPAASKCPDSAQIHILRA